MAFIVSIVPSAIDRLLQLTNASKGQPAGVPASVTITDGPGTSNNTGDQLIIGGDNPDENHVNVADGVQSWAHATGTARDEDADLVCTALGWTGNGGDAGQKAARDKAYAIASGVAGVCVADYTLGGLDGLLWAVFGGQSSLTYRLDPPDVTAVLVFRIHLKARI